MVRNINLDLIEENLGCVRMDGHKFLKNEQLLAFIEERANEILSRLSGHYIF